MLIQALSLALRPATKGLHLGLHAPKPINKMNAHCYDQENFRERVVLKKVSGIGNTTKQMKILFIGNSGVGKSSLVHRIRKDEFPNIPIEPTLNFTPAVMGAEFDRKTYLVELQDTAGQERYNAIFRDFYRHAHGAMIVYDITDYESYEKIMYWMVEVQKHALQNDTAKFPFLLLGNKVDKNERHIDGTIVAEDLGISGFIRTSAKSGEGIRDAIKMMIGLIVTRYTDQELDIPNRENNVTINSSPTANNNGMQHNQQGHSAPPEEQKCSCVI